MRTYHLDLKKAVDKFCANVEKLAHLPLITDEELALVYGLEVTEALESLSLYNRQEKVCLNCKDKCCRLVGCELFHTNFTQCPVYDHRPALCRMHFCKQFASGDNSLVKDLGDIFLDCLIEAERLGSQKAKLFDSPPLNRVIPGLLKDILPHIQVVKEGSLDEASARSLIMAEVKRYRFR